MLRFRKYFFSLIAFALFEAVMLAQSGTSVSATGTIVAEIIPVFSATETSQMNFGRFSPGPLGGEIILTPDGNISIMGSINKGAGTHNAASFYVSGDDNASFTLTLPNGPILLKHATSTKTMIIKDWNTNPGQGPGSGILQDGFQVVYIGATLKVGPIEDNPVGIYAGTYSVTFDFN